MSKKGVVKKVLWYLALVVVLSNVYGYDSDINGMANSQNILFVDVNNPACDNGHFRTQALDGNTPWCGLQIDKIESGDIVYFRAGDYITPDSEYDFYGKSFEAPVTISGYPGERPVFGNYKIDYLVPNDLWEDIRDNKWRTNTPVYSDRHCTMVYAETDEMLMSYNSADRLDNSGTDWPEGFYASNDGDTITVRFDDNKNPNEVPLYIACERYRLFKVQNANNIIFKDLDVKYSTIAFNIKDSTGITLDNVKVTGGVRNAVYIENSGSSDIEIKNSYFGRNHPDDWPWQTVKSHATREEVSAIDISTSGGQIRIIDNVIEDYFNGIMFNTKSQHDNTDSVISGNILKNIYDDALEIENYCSNSVFENNIIEDAFVGISISPAISENCIIRNNIIDATKQILAYGDTYWTGEGFKVMADNVDFQAVDLHIHDNTIIGKGISSTANRENSQKDTLWQNNVFDGTNQAAIYKSGDYDDNVNYDYNLYFTQGNTLFSYWQDDTNPDSYSTLETAKSGTGNPGSWDFHSLNTDPLLESEYTPTESSPVIDAGTDTGISTDVYGNPIYGTPDIGAVEYQPSDTMGDILYIGDIRIYSDGRFRYLSDTGAATELQIRPATWAEHANDEKRSVWMDLSIVTWDDVMEWSLTGSNNAVVEISGLSDSQYQLESPYEEVLTPDSGVIVIEYSVSDTADFRLVKGENQQDSGSEPVVNTTEPATNTTEPAVNTTDPVNSSNNSTDNNTNSTEVPPEEPDIGAGTSEADNATDAPKTNITAEMDSQTANETLVDDPSDTVALSTGRSGGRSKSSGSSATSFVIRKPDTEEPETEPDMPEQESKVITTSDKPINLPGLPNVYAWMGIQGAIEETVQFSVKNTWKKDKDIVLSGYDRDWQNMPTKKLYEDPFYTYYEAETKGLRYFAIRARNITIEQPVQIPIASLSPVISNIENNFSFYMLRIVALMSLISLTAFHMSRYLVRKI